MHNRQCYLAKFKTAISNKTVTEGMKMFVDKSKGCKNVLRWQICQDFHPKFIWQFRWIIFGILWLFMKVLFANCQDVFNFVHQFNFNAFWILIVWFKDFFDKVFKILNNFFLFAVQEVWGFHFTKVWVVTGCWFAEVISKTNVASE